MTKFELRNLYRKEKGIPEFDDIPKYADWLEEKITADDKQSTKLLDELCNIGKYDMENTPVFVMHRIGEIVKQLRTFI